MAKTILTAAQIAILAALTKDNIFNKDFYLTGGTALSEYYLHHRLSEDLDFFSEKEIDQLWLTTLVKKVLKDAKAIKYDLEVSYNRNLIHFIFKDFVIKTEFTYFPFPQIEKPITENGLKIDSLTDIATNKFFTIYQKPSARHFIDLYLILETKKYTWEQLEKLAKLKFDTVIDPIQLGSQLIKSHEIADLPKMGTTLPEYKWRSYFSDLAKSLKDKFAK